MFKIGLSGGMGAGKSTVSKLLVAKDAYLIDSDFLAAKAILPGEVCYSQIVEVFGRQILVNPELSSSFINKKILADLVFSDKDNLKIINSIVHPYIRFQTREIINSLDENSIVVCDVPLLVENSLKSDYDIVIIVLADLKTRIERVLATKKFSIESIKARIDNQVTDEQRKVVADYLIYNNSHMDELAKYVDTFWLKYIMK